jgi:isopenicillin-N N-acyltransferase-like protein
MERDQQTSLPLIEARGTHREIGRQVGEAAREPIRRSVAYYEEHIEWLAGMPFAAAEARALRLLRYAEHDLPQYVDELTGMAEGSGVSFEKLLVLNCGEEILCAAEPGAAGPRAAELGAAAPPRPADRCTCLALSSPGRTVIGHNEDWIEADVENMVLLSLTAPDGTHILSLTGAAYLPMCGVNSHGIAFYGNTLYARDERPGVPNAFKHRWLLEAATRSEADARARMGGRARGSNHLNAEAGGAIWDVEVSAERAVTIEADGWLVHTNHFTAPQMHDLERSDSAGSRLRLERGRELVAAGVAAGDDPFDIVAGVLRDHANAPTSVCAHPVPDDPQDGPTTGSVIIELEERRMHVCAGRPCENAYRIVALG